MPTTITTNVNKTKINIQINTLMATWIRIRNLTNPSCQKFKPYYQVKLYKKRMKNPQLKIEKVNMPYLEH